MHLVNIDFKEVTGWQLRSKRGKTRYPSANVDSKGLSATGKAGREARRRQEETRAKFMRNANTSIQYRQGYL